MMASDMMSFHNYSLPPDVDADGTVSATDVLAVINKINSEGPHALPQLAGEGEAGTKYVDVDADGHVAAGDVLSVINFINAEGEGTNSDNKARYTLQIRDINGTLISTGGNATLRKDTEFFVELVATDVRPAIQGAFRGVFSVYSDILYDTDYAELARNEQQSIVLLSDNGSAGGFTPIPSTYSLTMPANASGVQGTAANIPVALDIDGFIDGPANAVSIRTALANALFSGDTSKVSTLYDAGAGAVIVTFLGVNNADLPNLTSPLEASGHAFFAQIAAGNSDLGGIQFSRQSDGSIQYPNDRDAEFIAGYGLNDTGSFTGASQLGRNPVSAFRAKFIARLPSGESDKVLVFTPDPLGDGSGSQQDMDRPARNTLVYANDIPDAANRLEREESLVQFGENSTTPGVFNNQFLLVGVTLTINSGPYASAPDTGFTVDENLPGGTNSVSIPVLDNDVVTGVTGAVKEIKSFTQPAAGGTVTQVGNNLVFTPSANFNGNASFTYVGGIVGNTNPNDTAVGSVSVTVAAVNAPPVVTVPAQQNAAGENVDFVFSGQITVADNDVLEAQNGLLSMTVAATTAGHTVTLGQTTGLTDLLGDGTASITFKGTPANVNAALAALKVSSSNQRGSTATITITANDQGNTGKPLGTPQTDTESVNVVFPDQNDAPVNNLNAVPIAGAPSVVVTFNGTYNFATGGNPITVTDVDAGTAATISATVAVSGAAPGTLHIDGRTDGPSITVTGTLAQVNAQLATLTYTAVPNSNTADVLTITSTDGGATGPGTNPPTVSTINLLLDPGVRPFAVSNSYAFAEGISAAQTLDVLADDFKVDAPPATTIVAVSALGSGQGTLVNNGTSLSYTPPGGDFFTPNAPITFTYTIHQDLADASTDSTATVTIRINNEADTPVGVADGAGNIYKATFDPTPGAVQAPLVVNAANGFPDNATNGQKGVLANDTNVDNNFGDVDYAVMTAVLVTGPTKGNLTLNSDGTFSYTATSFTQANPNDTFTYKVRATSPEGIRESADTLVTIRVTAPPAITNNSVEVNEGPATPIAVTTYSDASESSPLASVTIVSNITGSRGTISVAGDGKSFIYTPPDADFQTSRPAGVPPLTFTYRGKSADNRDTNVATMSITVKDVNDKPTAQGFSFLGVKRDGQIGVDQPVLVAASNVSLAPDVGEAFKVTRVNGVAADASGNTAAQATPKGGTVKLSNFQILYTSPTAVTAPNDPDTFTYAVSDFEAAGGAARENQQTSDPATVSVNVVAFVPKEVSGSVYVDSDNDAVFDANEKALAGVRVSLTGNDAFGETVVLFATTDADGKYVFPDRNDPSTPANFLLKPPNASGYTVTEVSPLFLAPGKDSNPSSPTNVDSTTLLQIVTNASQLDNQFNLKWSLTDQSAFDAVSNVSRIVGLNFGEGAISTDVANGGVQDLGGIKNVMLASAGESGFMLALGNSSQIYWNWSIEEDGGEWDGVTLLSAILSPDTHALTLTFKKGTATHAITLTEGYSIAGSSARFAKIGVSPDGSGYIIRIMGSFNGTEQDRHGLRDGMFAANGTMQAEGEAGSFANSADALFATQAWA